MTLNAMFCVITLNPKPLNPKPILKVAPASRNRPLVANTSKVETPYHDNDLILAPIISPQSGWQ
jgi:hypothetical protein